MIASAHVAAGFVAGMAGAYTSKRKTLRLATALGLGVLSHVALDAIPHSDYAPLAASTVPWVALCEVVGTCAIAAFILRGRLVPGWPWYLLPGLAGATIPDAKFVARIVLPKDWALAVESCGDYFHTFFHADPPSRLAAGWAAEIVATLLLLAVLTAFPRTGPAVKSGAGLEGHRTSS